MLNIKMMTEAEREAAREERLSEQGTEPPCPFCLRKRVKRSDYIRCNPCGVNWLEGEPLDRDPRAYRMQATKLTPMETAHGAPTATNTFDK